MAARGGTRTRRAVSVSEPAPASFYSVSSPMTTSSSASRRCCPGACTTAAPPMTGTWTAPPACYGSVARARVVHGGGCGCGGGRCVGGRWLGNQ